MFDYAPEEEPKLFIPKKKKKHTPSPQDYKL